jgi:hypothetical protein
MCIASKRKHFRRRTMANDQLLTGMIGAALVGASCAAPLPVVRLAPRDGNVAWIAGRAVTTQAEGGVRAAAAFEYQTGGTVGFRVEVQNDSPDTLDIDPRGMSFRTCPTEQRCAASQPVVDPEQMLIALDEARSEEEASAANTRAADSALLFLSIASDVADINRGHGQHAGDATTLAAVNLKSSETASQSRLALIDSQKIAWSTSTLRRTTLPPGHGAAGLVFVPLDRDAQYVWLHVRAGAHDFWFPFQQSVVTASSLRNESAAE